MLKNLLAVGAGGAIGAILRYGLSVLGAYLEWSSNISTFLVNIVGSFVMGILIAACDQGTALLLVTVGLCGGFTTFSTFSVQSVTLLQQGKWAAAAVYIAGTIVVCLLMAWLGCLLGQRLK